MKPSKYRQALDAYSWLMEEAKQRLSAMDTALAGQTGLPNGAIIEFCFLQLRMLCELIALGCLTAHGDLKAGKLKKSHKADQIIRRLGVLHPDFYPKAATQTKAGPEEYDAVLVSDGFLTKEELPRLYWRCGDILHRGSLRTIRSRRLPDIEEIASWKNKIEVLLRYHAIFMADKRTMVLFVLRNRANNDQVGWVTLNNEQMTFLLRD